ncbi:hypothetical protein HHL17_04800 [Chitinophaga sp. G-6-1-13]|uniref:YD repeat-containing protein n=1 Tax=Chitinophaga fulva TaxID=2728842 RepID=A0A848GKS8_9BACT|nr:hypothetical protein [Chitinophaga fulva]NML36508.1 hypothetical protein [Chitinophaga fulva]
MKFKCSSILLFLFIFYFSSVNAQTSQFNVTRVIPPSPTAAAMAKFGEIPVSYYTGVPNISIPLYEVKNNDLFVPISINYHSSGIKVEEEASWVGLGWSLSCGGAISRAVRGKDDLSPSGRGFPDCYLPTSIDPTTNLYMTPGSTTQRDYDLQFLHDVLMGEEDPEPDVFTFNFNGHSGKFILNKRSSVNQPIEAVLLSQADIKIEVRYVTASNGYQWTITDESGNKYYFGTPEVSVSNTGMGEDEWTADMKSLESVPEEIVSSWYLDKIISPAGAIIQFNYNNLTNGGTKRILSRSQTKTHITSQNVIGGCVFKMNDFMYFSTYSETRDVYLKEVLFPNGKIVFNTSNREDIEPARSNAPTYAQKLDNVSIYQMADNVSSLYKKYNLSYSYFGFGTYAEKRLRLDSIAESNGTESRSPYKFDYNSTQLPAKDSKSQDHWGYYNGAPNNSVNETKYGDHITNGTLVPPYMFYSALGDPIEYKGADRSPHAGNAAAASLTKITYPTGGNTQFGYSLNDYYHPRERIEKSVEVKWLTALGPDVPPLPTPYPNSFIWDITQPITVDVSVNMQCTKGNDCMTDQWGKIEYDVCEIYDITGGTPVFTQGIGCDVTYANQTNAENERSVYLTPGKYKFVVIPQGSFVSYVHVARPTWDTIRVINEAGPGLRISTITTYDGISNDNDQTMNYSYTTMMKDSIIASTGVLMTQPIYNYQEQYFKNCESNANPSTANAIVRTSSPTIPISNAAMGSPLGYSKVTVTQGNVGKTEYYYLNQADFVHTPTFPNVPTLGYIGNGLLKSQITYTNTGDGSFKKIKETELGYEEETTKRRTIKAMKMPASKAVTINTAWGGIVTYESVKFYDVRSSWIHPSLEKVKVYSQTNNDTVVTSTEHKYANPTWRQTTGKTIINSQNQVLTTTYKYPYDFPTDPNYNALANTHQIDKVVEEIITIEPSTHLQSVKKNYSQWPNNIMLPASVDVKTGIAAYETRLRNHAYTPDGRLLSQSKEGDIFQSYKWGYNNQYPVVEILNATANGFYYESFEEGTNTGILQSMAKTGKRVKASGFTVTFSIPDQREYWISYWYRTSATSAWIFKTAKYTGNNYTISDGAFIDEVRVQPKDALMKTFTYDPLIGMISETDASGKTIYYEYNNWGQLKLIKDDSGNILKQFDYQYQKPVTL